MPIPITGLFTPSGGLDAFNLVAWHDVASHNFYATTPPGVTNDVNDVALIPEGYVVGSFWYDITHDKAYVCLDNTAGAAVWTEITAVSSGGISGVDFAANGSHICFGQVVDLEQSAGVWISGTCIGGVAGYLIGGYPAAAAPTSISGVDILVKDTEVCFARAVDFHEGAGVWISGTCSGPEATILVGAYPATPAPSSISGVDAHLDNGQVCFIRAIDLHQTASVWISGTCAGNEVEYTLGAYPTVVPSSISGVDFDANGGDLGYGGGIDIEQRPGVWVSGTMAGGRAKYEVGAYPDVDPFISGVDVNLSASHLCFARTVGFQAGAGVWLSGTCAGDDAEFTVGAYPANLGPYLTGVAFRAHSAVVCFGQGLDLEERTGIWISASCAGGTAEYDIGAYPYTDVDPFLSGVSFLRNGGALCSGQGLDLIEGTGVWISGTCAGGTAHYTAGAYPSANTGGSNDVWAVHGGP